MKLELKNIKHSEFASHETFCYEANLYVNGKPFAHVSNDGQGSADYLYQDDRFKDLDAWNKCHALLKIHCEKEYARDYGHEWNNPDDGLIGMVLISSDGNWMMDGVKVVLKPRVMS